MADVEAAIAAAMSAAAPTAPPMSPVLGPETFSGDAMIVDSEPLQPPQLSHSPQPPLKRSRSPSDGRPVGGDEDRDEKRVKIEPAADGDLDEIARMVQAVQASVMKEFLSAPEPVLEHKTEPEPELVSHVAQPDEVFETTEHEQLSIESVLEAALNQERSPSGDMEPRPDTLWNNPRDYTRRKHIIPALGALAVDILIALSEQTLEDTVATFTSDLDSDITKEYGVLRAAFEIQRRQLLQPQDTSPFLDARKLRIKDHTREVIRIANLASTCASIFGTNEITLEEVNNHFLRIFVPTGRSLSDDAAELYLGLKTQLFIAILDGDLDKSKEQLLQDLFVTDVESSLRAHHPNLPLSTTELDFIANSKARKGMLSNASAAANSIYTLSKQFTYEAFLDNLSTYLNDNIDKIQAQVSGEMEAKAPTESPAPADEDIHDLASEFDLNAAIAEASRAAAEEALQPSADETSAFDDLSAFLTENVSRAIEQSRQAATSIELPSSITSATESASRATALALESIARNQYHPTALPHSTSQTPSSTNHHNHQPQQTQTASAQYFSYQQQQVQQQQQQQQQSQQQVANIQTNYQAPSDHLPPNQSDSTPALYERARQAAAARSSTHARREGTHSTRRPWSPEEEKALMMGLDMVKGPHWSQILSLFGPSGSLSQILADRTQVQLKDKARNLKLFFLKTGSEMPYYLQCVTGELKTRAPTQAARKEAEEKARMNSEEHQAHMNGILALAGGLQNNTAQRSSSSRPMPSSTTPQQQQLNHSHSHQVTPNPTRQPSQQIASPQPPRPTIPAPQPVSLPTLTPTSQQQHPQQPSKPQQSIPPPEYSTAAQTQVKVEEPAVQQQGPTAAPETPPVPDHSNLSIEDQALLSLKAAMEGESAAAAAAQSATTFIKQEEQH
ncbi:hypothetical protein F5B22DRAFT_631220 [Xylaria bambusicola]|uniref:uncharacterized protein n=1 Tax=Xylaria bambusicola TaxID=326684 RepID=UPI0020088CD0|nr:uncharacterized protein F5B22DRAFT_631220 [Xylaria bambusicola]KAI0502927.1 hypothetical protein F5B22DRAFT_631220 [Xylaria bambusicola]